MKRELKFRSWNIPNNLMYFNIQKGVLCENEKGILVVGASFDTICKDAGSIVEQFINETDKNKKEVYEGDILDLCQKEYPEEHGYRVVVFHDCGFKAKFKSDGEYYHTEINDGLSWVVVGNIHQNPDLIH